ncbi:FUSC family protein [Methylopila henanensis]|uniref:FUSC family protein n=1 Tax=Methylopila henanensis TaxID=873516 RepID=A0ABW4K5R0_9HYPH
MIRPPSIFASRTRDMRLALKVAVAAGLAFVLATLAQLPQGYWSVITAVLVVQGSVAGTIVAARERAAGTVVGALFGGAVALLHPQTVLSTSLALSLSVAALAFLAAGRPALKVAPVTAAILIVATASPGGSFDLVYERIAEILLGCVIGIAVTFAIFPTKLHHELTGEAEEIAREIAGLLGDLMNWASNPNDAHKLLGAHDRIRRRLSAFERAVLDARKAPGSSALGQQRGALVRALWRVRNDSAAIGRACSAIASADMPDVKAAAEAALADASQRLMAAAKGPDAAVPRPAPEIRRRLDEAVQALRVAGPEAGRDPARAMAALSLAYSLGNLDGNVAALAERLSEARAA